MVLEVVLNGRMWIRLVKFNNYYFLYIILLKLLVFNLYFFAGYICNKCCACPLVFGGSTFRYLESRKF